LIDALGGVGSLPCWISEALCATAGGSVAVAPLAAGSALAAPGPVGAGWLMTVLMTVVLWMLA
jgi:hypothetical protein